MWTERVSEQRAERGGREKSQKAGQETGHWREGIVIDTSQAKGFSLCLDQDRKTLEDALLRKSSTIWSLWLLLSKYVGSGQSVEGSAENWVDSDRFRTVWFFNQEQSCCQEGSWYLKQIRRDFQDLKVKFWRNWRCSKTILNLESLISDMG